MKTARILFLCLLVYSCDNGRQKRLEEIKTALDDESADLFDLKSKQILVTGHSAVAPPKNKCRSLLVE